MTNYMPNLTKLSQLNELNPNIDQSYSNTQQSYLEVINDEDFIKTEGKDRFEMVFSDDRPQTDEKLCQDYQQQLIQMEEDDRYSNRQGTSKFKEIIEEERKSF